MIFLLEYESRAFLKKEEYFRNRIDSEIRNRLNLTVAKQKVLEKTIEDDDDDVESNKASFIFRPNE